jgi:hypothetical protein
VAGFGVVLEGAGFVDFGREGRDVGEGGAVAFGDSEKDAGLALGDEGNIGAEAGAASGFLEHGGGGGGVAKLDPPEADAGGVAGVVEAFDGFELIGLEVNVEGSGGLGGGAGDVEQILEKLEHVGGG